MTQKFSRGQWSQIVSRIRQAKFIFNEAWKCLICGKQFSGHACPHSVEDNEAAITRAQAEAVS